MALDIKETGPGGKSYFFPVVLRVSGVSQYNPDQISFEGVPDFWQLPKDSPVPPKGTIAVFHLATKPKSGANAKPGSMYRDIVRIEKATDDEKANYSPSPQAPHSERVEYDAPQHQQNGSGAPDGMYDQYGKPTRAYWDDQQAQIRVSMAFKELSVWLAHIYDGSQGYSEQYLERHKLWEKWFSEAARGLPLTPVQDEEPPASAETVKNAVLDDSPLVQAAKDMGATEQIEMRDPAERYAHTPNVGAKETVEQLPW